VFACQVKGYWYDKSEEKDKLRNWINAVNDFYRLLKKKCRDFKLIYKRCEESKSNIGNGQSQ
jgi:hypothetical protein